MTDEPEVTQQAAIDAAFSRYRAALRTGCGLQKASDELDAALLRGEPRHCEECGKAMSPDRLRTRAKYCSRQCNLDASNRRMYRRRGISVPYRPKWQRE